MASLKHLNRAPISVTGGNRQRWDWFFFLTLKCVRDENLQGPVCKPNSISKRPSASIRVRWPTFQSVSTTPPEINWSVTRMDRIGLSQGRVPGTAFTRPWNNPFLHRLRTAERSNGCYNLCVGWGKDMWLCVSIWKTICIFIQQIHLFDTRSSRNLLHYQRPVYGNISTGHFSTKQ